MKNVIEGIGQTIGFALTFIGLMICKKYGSFEFAMIVAASMIIISLTNIAAKNGRNS